VVKRRVAGKALATMKEQVRFITKRSGGRTFRRKAGREIFYVFVSAKLAE
jgi:hypothetical protein